ncbi:Spermatogenesis-associated protein 5-like protein 1 [Trichoplax sp. H2]|nr:Spermatogenesis-associated protein 5-like protein 1 [Trichoplax sp. H2]|eukprot:RDD36958.1 Spermatogenesis-associated protein 5-like protein 1 [Trichoplax sp. H2]
MAQFMQQQLMLCEARDRGSSKCRLNHEIVALLGSNIRIGSFLKIQSDQCSFLCSVWPTRNLQNAILIDPIMMCDRTPQRCTNSPYDFNVFNRKLSIPCTGISLIESSPAEWVKIVIIMSKKQLKKRSSVSDDAIQKLIHYLLLDKVVTIGTVMDCQHWPISKQTMKYIEIVEVEPSSKFALVNGQTKILISSCVRLPSQVERINIGGLDSVGSMLKDLAKVNFQHCHEFKKLGLPCVKAVMLHGPSGVGKTLLVRKLAQDLDTALVRLNGADIYAAYEGESEKNLQKYFDKACQIARKECCILFIDEVDALCPGQDNDSENASEEYQVVSLLASLLEEVKRENLLFIIGATNRPEAISPCLYGPCKFEQEIYIGIPNVSQRESILQLYTRDLHLDADVNLVDLAEMSCGYVGADLKLLCKEAMFMGLERMGKTTATIDQESCQLCAKDFINAIHRIVPSSRRAAIGTVELKKISWDDIGGLENIKLKIQQAIEWPLKYPQAFARLGLPRPRGVLLFGPPGCSKTTLVRAAASSCHVTFLSLSGAQLYSPYIGDSERAIRQAFLQARTSSPCILFLDEIDTIVSRRLKNSKNSVQDRVLSTLLNEMDGISTARSYHATPEKKMKETEPTLSNVKDESKPLATAISSTKKSNYQIDDGVIVVCATNRPDMLDDALLRPGRMDRIIYVPPPERDERLKILKVHTRCMPLESNVDLATIADTTNMYSGADLENVCREAAMEAMRHNGVSVEKVNNQNFIQAARIINASLSIPQLNEYEKFCQHKLHTK